MATAVAASTGPADRGTAAPATTAASTVAAKPSSGCGATAKPAVHLQRRTLVVDGVSRWYLLSTPPAQAASGGGPKPLPLVIEFHGLAEGASIAAETSNFSDLGAKDGFVTAFPNGTGTPVGWNTSLQATPNVDFTFVTDLLATLEQSLCIDQNRVYATGLSDGAIMSSSLACRMAGMFAAIAPVSGIRFPQGCHPSRPVPILVFHGTSDPILPFNGGPSQLGNALSGKGVTALPASQANLNGPGYPATVAQWAAQNGCGRKATDRQITAHVIQRTYPCPKDADIEFLIVEGGGHSWPGSAFDEAIAKFVGPTNTEIDATSLIWDFFKAHPLPS